MVSDRLLEAREALQGDDDWTIAQTLFGITTSYRRERDGTLSIKLEGELNDVPLFEQLCVLRETDLFHLWAPFMSQSRKLLQITKIELGELRVFFVVVAVPSKLLPALILHCPHAVSWFIISVPIFGLRRDAAFHAFGCDCMEADGSVLITARSVEAYPGAFIPPPSTGWGSARMDIRSFSGLVTILSPTSARTRLIANIDPKLSLPQKLIDFTMKKMCGVLLLCLQKQAKVREWSSRSGAKRSEASRSEATS